MIHVHINIGSNLGDRENNLRRAVASLRQLAVDDSSVRVSDVVVSPPWGFDSDNEFMNIGMSFDTLLTPTQLLAATQRIERTISTAFHRASDGSYIDRLIDIDLIAACTITEASATALIKINTTALTLPHPRTHLRPFVLTPLKHIDPLLFNLLQMENYK